MTSPPPLAHVLETVLYARDLAAAERFYAGILGLPVHARRPGRHVFFRLPRAMLLVFDPGASARGGSVPAHGCHGPGHVCFAVPASALETWRRHLERHGVTIEHEQRWASGHRSLYVRDPAGNSVEFAPAAIWDLPDPTGFPQEDRPPGARLRKD